MVKLQETTHFYVFWGDNSSAAQGQGMVFKKFYEDFCLDQPCGVMITKYFTENFFPFNKWNVIKYQTLELLINKKETESWV